MCWVAGRRHAAWCRPGCWWAPFEGTAAAPLGLLESPYPCPALSACSQPALSHQAHVSWRALAPLSLAAACSRPPTRSWPSCTRSSAVCRSTQQTRWVGAGAGGAARPGACAVLLPHLRGNLCMPPTIAPCPWIQLPIVRLMRTEEGAKRFYLDGLAGELELAQLRFLTLHGLRIGLSRVGQWPSVEPILVRVTGTLRQPCSAAGTLAGMCPPPCCPVLALCGSSTLPVPACTPPPAACSSPCCAHTPRLLQPGGAAACAAARLEVMGTRNLPVDVWAYGEEDWQARCTALCLRGALGTLAVQLACKAHLAQGSRRSAPPTNPSVAALSQCSWWRSCRCTTARRPRPSCWTCTPPPAPAATGCAPC